MASTAIKYDYSLNFGELSAFFAIKEAVHKAAVRANKDISKLTKEEARAITASLSKAAKEQLAKTVIDGTNTDEPIMIGTQAELIVNNLRLERKGCTECLIVGGELAGTYDIINKVPRAVVTAMYDLNIGRNGSTFKLDSIYDSYYGEQVSIAFKGRTIGFCVELKEGTTGIKGKREAFVKVICGNTLYIDKLSKY